MTETIGGRRKVQTLKSNSPLDDPRDPVYHDMQGDRAERKIMARHASDQDRLTEAHGQVLHCEHGSYVGHNRALAYRCPRCPEGKAAQGSTQ